MTQRRDTKKSHRGARVSCPAVRRPRRCRPAGAPPAKQAAVGIYAAPKAVRDTLERCLGDTGRNWSYRAIAELLQEKHGYKMHIQSVSEYRQGWLARTASPTKPANAAPVVVQISIPPGARIKVLRSRQP